MTPITLRLRRIGIDTYQEPVVYMSSECSVGRSEGWEALTRLQVSHASHVVLATLHVVTSDLLGPHEVSLSDAAWRLLGASEGDVVHLSSPPPLESLSYLRSKVYGRRLDPPQLHAIVADIAAGRYSAVHLAAFVTACAGGRLDLDETIALTRAMIDVGERLVWKRGPIVDKHSVGGLPGNRTTMLVVPIVTSLGLTMPKTSSRAITSPAGTADAMETIAPVDLDLATMRRVVEREGGCIVWGGSARLSPADDVIIRVERPLDLDSEGQLVASVLSKKAAAGSTHVVIDIPVGPTAKVRGAEAATALGALFAAVGQALGFELRIEAGDGSQPIGRGIGPALEARDVLAVLRQDSEAPADLRERALVLAGSLVELATGRNPGTGYPFAQGALDRGDALRKLEGICAAQGGMHEPPVAGYRHAVLADRAGVIVSIDNRRLARVAKLAGAPKAPAAGLDLHVRLGSRVEPGQPLYTLHAEAPGELAYALEYQGSSGSSLTIGDPT
ncbi:MAG: thymidine phosphorylase family protein [Gemmatimonadales bacterium]|nr:thymidine phosphorylase family protein [Gemmatimonadales bacterium]